MTTTKQTNKKTSTRSKKTEPKEQVTIKVTPQDISYGEGLPTNEVTTKYYVDLKTDTTYFFDKENKIWKTL